MRRIIHWIIGLPAMAACFYLLLFAEIPKGAKFSNPDMALNVMAGFCGIVAIACLIPRSRPVTLRLVGICLLALYATFVYEAFGTRDWLRSICGFALIGIPSGLLAIYGRYPRWGWMAGVFLSAEDLADPKPPEPVPLPEGAVPSWMTSARMTDIQSEQRPIE